jgi:haloalkane dehalogenase
MDYLAEWKRRFPSAETHSFANAGHYVLEDETNAIISKIGTFLESNHAVVAT